MFIYWYFKYEVSCYTENREVFVCCVWVSSVVAGCIILFTFLVMSGIKEPHFLLYFLSALAVKGELATNLLSMLPCCSTGYQNRQFSWGQRTPVSPLDFAKEMEKSQNLRGKNSRMEHLQHLLLSGTVFFHRNFAQHLQHRSLHQLTLIMINCFSKLFLFVQI